MPHRPSAFWFDIIQGNKANQTGSRRVLEFGQELNDGISGWTILVSLACLSCLTKPLQFLACARSRSARSWRDGQDNPTCGRLKMLRRGIAPGTSVQFVRPFRHPISYDVRTRSSGWILRGAVPSTEPSKWDPWMRRRDGSQGAAPQP